MYVATLARKLIALTAYKEGGAAGPPVVPAAALDGGDLELFTNLPAISEDSVAADFTVPTFTGYAAKTVAAWGDEYVGPDGRYKCEMPSQQWNGPGDATGQDIQGWFYLDAGGDLVAAGYFDEGPQSVFSAADAIILQLESFGPDEGNARLLSAD